MTDPRAVSYTHLSIILNELISFATQYGQVQKSLMKNFIFPYALLDPDGKLLWVNEEFTAVTGKEKTYHKSITTIFPEIHVEKLPTDDQAVETDLVLNGRDYRVMLRKVSIADLVQQSDLLEAGEQRNYLISMYLFDETDLNAALRKNEENQLVTGLLYLDNYEEAMESVEEVRRSLLTALINRKINKYFSSLDGVIKQLEKDKYCLLYTSYRLKYPS